MKAWKYPLLPFALLMTAVTRLRNWAYDRGWLATESAGLPVISVGNITVGGTGKTPMAEFLLAQLLLMGYQPAYLSRGYGRQTKGYRFVDPATGGAAEYGDEAYQVATRFPTVPVAVCERRITGAKALRATHAIDVLVLDDAFQHRNMARDLDWVMIDTTRMPTLDWPIPAGRLREGLGGLRRADTLILSKWQDTAAMERIAQDLQGRFPLQKIAAFALRPISCLPFFPTADILPMSTPSETQPLNGLQVVAFSGIGNPQHFEDTLAAAGVAVHAALRFADHHVYDAGDMDKILAVFHSQKEIKGKLPPALILTTEKDYFRLKAMPWMQRYRELPLVYVTVGMVPAMGWETMALDIKKIINKF